MALFSRKRETSLLPADIVDRVVGYIRTEAHSPNAPASFDTPGLIYSLHSTAHADPALFIEKLASAVLAVAARPLAAALGWSGSC